MNDHHNEARGSKLGTCSICFTWTLDKFLAFPLLLGLTRPQASLLPSYLFAQIRYVARLIAHAVLPLEITPDGGLCDGVAGIY